MPDIFLDRKPYKVLKYFSEISKIPRGSGKEEAISHYLLQFANNRNLEVYQDSYNNILIKKEASPGLKDQPTVILQGHMDMVWEKNKETLHDFLTEGIKLNIVGDDLYAENTTLGADNGIAIAMVLALLDSDDILHPKIEALFTVEEETGLAGAMNFDANNLEGKYLINLDSEDDREILTSCAGGVRLHHKLQLDTIPVPKDFLPYTISITGLRGGHSGMDIGLNRANANKLLARILYSIKKEMKFHLVNIMGGSKDNAIPREAEALVLIDKTEKENFEIILSQSQRMFRKEYQASDENISLSYDFMVDSPKSCLTKEVSDKLIHLMMILPNGIQSMSPYSKDLVESSINMAVIKTNEKEIEITSSARSSVNSKKEYLLDVCETIAKALDTRFTTNSSYPGWEYEKDSSLRDHAVRVYKRMFNEEPKITAIHAGVECGIFKEKIPQLDIISIGPTMYDVHTPEEHVSISSIEKSWSFLLELLKSLE